MLTVAERAQAWSCPEAASTDDASGPHRFLPETEVFRPLLADTKEPRFAASLRYTDVHEGELTRQRSDDAYWSGVVAFAENFPLYGYHPSPCRGLQVGMAGGVFSSFNLDTISENLVDSDFRVAIPVTARLGRWSARLQIYHQSSHLGDEFILENEMIDRYEFTFEAVEGLISYGVGPWRVYGGGGGIVHRVVEMRRLYAQIGGEWRLPAWSIGANEDHVLQPLVGLDIQSFQTRDWGVTASFKGGLASGGRSRHRRIRLMVVMLTGYAPFGQFFRNNRMTSGGLELQFDL